MATIPLAYSHGADLAAKEKGYSSYAAFEKDAEETGLFDRPLLRKHMEGYIEPPGEDPNSVHWIQEGKRFGVKLPGDIAAKLHASGVHPQKVLALLRKAQGQLPNFMPEGGELQLNAVPAKEANLKAVAEFVRSASNPGDINSREFVKGWDGWKKKNPNGSGSDYARYWDSRNK